MFLRKKLEKMVSRFYKAYFKKDKNWMSKIALQPVKIKGFGDYTTRAFKISDERLQSFINNLLSAHSSIFSQIKLKNGFANFYIKDSFLIACFYEYLKTDSSKLLNIGRDKKIIIEFFSANPTGRLHVGNVRGGLLGDMLANLLQQVGYKIWREYYLQNAQSSKQIQELGKSALGTGSQYTSDYLNKIVATMGFVNKDPAAVGKALANKIFEDQKNLIENGLGIRFNSYFEEHQLYQSGAIKESFDILKKMGLVFFKNGAWFLEAKKTGLLKDKVIIRKDRMPTYLLVDVAYHINKLIKRKFDKAINVWGADHQGHLLNLEAVLKKLNLFKRFKTVLTHMVLLQTRVGPQKLSKRLGTLVDLEEFVAEFGIETVRFFIAKYDPNKEIILNLELMKERSFNNPLYYLQYSGVRAKHILDKAKFFLNQPKKFSQNKILKIAPLERELIKQIFDFDDIITYSAKNLVIHPLVDNVLKLAEKFNNFYENCQVIQSEEPIKTFRLLLTRAFLNKLQTVLRILGISLPTKM